MAILHVHLLISGIVQGVGFRYSTQKEANKLGLFGSVQNTADEMVEVYAEGEEVLVRKLVDWCKKGPPHAQVDRINILEEVSTLKGYKEFTILHG